MKKTEKTLVKVLVIKDRAPTIRYPTGSELEPQGKRYPLGSRSQLVKAEKSFHPNLSWSHYRALMRVYMITETATPEYKALTGHDRIRD